MQKERVGAIGIGLLGSALTSRLLAHGYQVSAFDLDPARLRDHEKRGGLAVSSVREAVEHHQFVLLALPTGEVVREVSLGPGGIATGAKPGTIVLDATTARPADSIITGRALADHGIAFLDASISGSSAMAWEGDIVVMVGGPEEAVWRARPLLEAIARSVHHVGQLGAGARTKLIVNLALGAHRLALAEALVLGEQAGLDLATLLNILKDGTAYSRAMDGWGDRMVAGNHDAPMSRIRQHAKDVRLILEEGNAVGAPLWLTSTLSQVLLIAEQQGLADADISAVIEVLRRLAGKASCPEDDDHEPRGA